MRNENIAKSNHMVYSGSQHRPPCAATLYSVSPKSAGRLSAIHDLLSALRASNHKAHGSLCVRYRANLVVNESRRESEWNQNRIGEIRRSFAHHRVAGI